MQAHYPSAGATAVFSKAGLAEGTNAATIKTAAPNGAGIDFAIKGLGYHYADTDNIAVTAHPVQAALYSCLYLVQINASGTVSTVQGTAQLTADVTNGSQVLQWPQPSDNNCPIGGYKVAVASGYTFTNGTTDHSATGITVTYYDFLGGIPVGPVTA